MNIPNSLSVFRIFLIPVYAVLFFVDTAAAAAAAGAVLVVSGLTDLFDGYIARRFDMVTRLGKVLDPLADKLTQIAVAVCLTIKHIQLWPLFSYIVFKEAAMMTAGLAIIKKGFVVSSRWYGKTATFLLYFAIAAFTFFPDMGQKPMAVISTAVLAMLAVSLFGYSSLVVGCMARADLGGVKFSEAANAAYRE